MTKTIDREIMELIMKTKHNARKYFYTKYRKLGIEKEAADMQANMDMTTKWLPAIRLAATNNIPLSRHVLKSLPKGFRISLMHQFPDWGRMLGSNGWVEANV